ncbi:hypothetical protein CONCODRAFT_12513 [Conidiobolus coronatus NRRL 28638]|uniref:G-protein coupled receptors family 1 profile domain-containing protein n=1 Tax=Conidiobolus coronatus (strain ATCC 28846 / CBS 209.66 / NRRL 28638) TaxID=796925 RepID=A0A137NSP6_CONC2|nr:hypothetical protein CONCODRAFT_12513 [Conidiobolus coronatus NRRL 28638]|eukprot:KXN65793.1 hypothetical protein CONCODRAFT_12513 [Conidiobolus coronatus NRRL 28638]
MLDGNILPSHLYCGPYLKSSPKMIFLYFIHALIWVIPCWVSTYCYFVIGIKVYKKLKQMENEATASNENDQLIRIQNQKRNLIIQLVVVFNAFNLAYSPTYITLLLRYITGYIRPPFVDAILILIIEFTRAVDPIITITFQPELNYEFQAIIAKSFAKFKSYIQNLFK